ncbi:hypothetical protein CRG98_017757 [Punica granatum]|uniref:Uncharacterized protein n=1 Tax=Punica granatum TaxID=22663 RepID=A0A2I0JZW4_PUNGR|nr:hypothetical protein CRG98_017757 [Punica granatum]
MHQSPGNFKSVGKQELRLRCWDKLVVPLVNYPTNWIEETRSSLMTVAALADELSLAVAWEVEAQAYQLERLEARNCGRNLRSWNSKLRKSNLRSFKLVGVGTTEQESLALAEQEESEEMSNAKRRSRRLRHGNVREKGRALEKKGKRRGKKSVGLRANGLGFGPRALIRPGLRPSLYRIRNRRIGLIPGKEGERERERGGKEYLELEVELQRGSPEPKSPDGGKAKQGKAVEKGDENHRRNGERKGRGQRVRVGVGVEVAQKGRGQRVGVGVEIARKGRG